MAQLKRLVFMIANYIPLQEKLSATEDKEQQNAIAARINAVSAERENYLKTP